MLAALVPAEFRYYAVANRHGFSCVNIDLVWMWKIAYRWVDRNKHLELGISSCKKEKEIKE